MEISQEVLLANILTLRLDPIAGATKPEFYDRAKFDGELGEEAYRQFWEYANTQAARWYAFLNEEVFGKGVPLPYWKLSFLTKLSFHPGAMSSVVHLFYNN